MDFSCFPFGFFSACERSERRKICVNSFLSILLLKINPAESMFWWSELFSFDMRLPLTQSQWRLDVRRAPNSQLSWE